MPDKDIWVYRFNGTIQCDNSAEEIPLEVMRKELEELIGQQNVLDAREDKLIVIRACGFPTGACNVYHITPQGWILLKDGYSGNPGYRLWPDQKFKAARSEDGYGPLPLHCLAESAESMHGRVCDLVGKLARVYTTGDILTSDWNPERVNIELSKQGRIVKIWFG